MGFRPNTKGNAKQPSTGVSKAFKAKKKYIRKTRKMGTRKTAKTNAYTIATLLKRVRLTELNAHGCIQSNKQSSVIFGTQPPYGGGSYIDVRTQYPVLFNVNNFASVPSDVGPSPLNRRCPIFQMQGASGSAVVTAIGDFIRKNYQGVGPAIDTVKMSLWAPKNLDVPDTGKYYAQSSSYRITVQVPDKFKCRVSILFFTQRSESIPTSTLASRNLILPEALDGLGQMCEGNYLPRTGFKLYRKYEKIIDPSNNQSSSKNTFYFNFEHNKLINQFATVPATPDTEIPNPGTGWNFNNVPVTQPLWCLISTDMPGIPGETGTDRTLTQIQVIRSLKWRDPIGADN